MDAKKEATKGSEPALLLVMLWTYSGIDTTWITVDPTVRTDSRAIIHFLVVQEDFLGLSINGDVSVYEFLTDADALAVLSVNVWYSLELHSLEREKDDSVIMSILSTIYRDATL